MKVLILCSYYPPDSAISAVRPYMLAKYLNKSGNNVTVIRSGSFNKKPDDSLEQLDGVNVISFLGENSDAERYLRGEKIAVETTNKRLSRIPNFLRNHIVTLYHFIRGPIYAKHRIENAEKRFQKQKEVLNKMKNEQFDVVFSSYSELENIYAGEYAAHLFNAKWVMDFRDPVVSKYSIQSFFWNFKTKAIQKYAIEHADLVTAVSEGLSKELLRNCGTANIKTLYNGYDAVRLSHSREDTSYGNHKLSFCYTGQIYGARRKAFKAFVRCISELVKINKINPENIIFHYAGANSIGVKELFKEYNLINILVDHGSVGRGEAEKIQESSDVFLVLSWNTKKSQGVLTGKFYEGIRADKPILAMVSGKLGNSELYTICEKYNYGFCQDRCEYSSQNKLREYLENLYKEKSTLGYISYSTSRELKEAFRYDCIVEKLQHYIEELN